MSYGPKLPATRKLVVRYVDKILKGAKPAELPVEQPSTIELVIILKWRRRSASHDPAIAATTCRRGNSVIGAVQVARGFGGFAHDAGQF
jgi:hypothetical protein